MSEPSNSLVQNNLNNRARGIKAEQANDMKHITRYTQDPAVLDLRTAQPSTCPDHHVVGQRAKQHQHVLRLKALLRAFGQTQPLLVAFEAGFDASPALIGEGHRGGQDGDRIGSLRAGPPQHGEHLLSRHRADQHAVGEGAVLSATAHGNALDQANIASRGVADPAKRALEIGRASCRERV